MNSSVAVLLVSHDGAPLASRGHRRDPRAAVAADRVVAVDTGSKDDSADLLTAAFGDGRAARPAPRRSRPPSTLGLEHVGDCEWVWILHDDANPDPGRARGAARRGARRPARRHPRPQAPRVALAAAAARARRHHLRHRPSRDRARARRVRPGPARRRPRGARGQHRRDAGPAHGARAARRLRRAAADLRQRHRLRLARGRGRPPHDRRAAGRRLPRRGRAPRRCAGRRSPAGTRTTRSAAPRSTRCWPTRPARSLPFQVVRLALGTLLRMLGFLLVRQVGQALDELAALVSLYSSPRELLAARRTRAATQVGRPRRASATCWRRGGCPTGTGSTSSATWPPPRPTRPPTSPSAAGPPSWPSRAAAPPAARGRGRRGPFAEDSGLVVRFLTNPVARARSPCSWSLALVGARDAFGAVAGGALSPVPGGGRRLVAAAPRVLAPARPGHRGPRAGVRPAAGAAATLLGGSPAAAMSAAAGARRAGLAVGRLAVPAGASAGWSTAAASRARCSPGARSTYALVPVVSGAWGEGRFGVVAVAALLPWLAHAALGFADPEPDRRWRAAWRCGLLLALGTAFAPVLFWFGARPRRWSWSAPAFAICPRAMRDRSVWGPPAAALGDGAGAAGALVAARRCCTAPGPACSSTPAGCR